MNQQVWLADFSELKTPGEYILEVPNVGKSVAFAISGNAFNFAAKTSMRAFYLWRCGTAVEGEFNGVRFHQNSCHLHDGFEDYLGKPGSQRDGTGGWHDAGDYGKYIVNAGITWACFLWPGIIFNPILKKCSSGCRKPLPDFPTF